MVGDCRAGMGVLARQFFSVGGGVSGGRLYRRIPAGAADFRTGIVSRLSGG